MSDDPHLDAFTEHRRTLVGAAYRVLGSVSDAEDVVQEVWFRWSDVDIAEVREPRAYLLRITTRLALNRLRQQKRRREQYIGPWLPEPLSDVHEVGADAPVELAESVSMAMLVVLESLSPLERAAFVLREVFEVPFAEIAKSLDRSEAAVRQLVHRARTHVDARASRQHIDAETHRSVTLQFLESVQNGSIVAVVRLMSPDVELVSDGGGKRRAALKPIHGGEKILRFIAGVMARPDTPMDDVR
ncbi:MAG: RNA polymerase sigma factor SigJ, partial [Nocardioidaceae bacterium]